MSVRILTGHVLDVLKGLPDGSVHCAVTSPPYMGLRSYGTEPQVWGGDPLCSHSWITQTVSPRHSDDGVTGSTLQGGKTTQSISQRTPDQHDTCSRCTAWRGHLGLEPSLSLYIEHLVMVFREVKRVLHPSGVLWCNLGDSYNTRASGSGRQMNNGQVPEYRRGDGFIREQGMKNKDLMMVPARVAIALCDDGWYLRSDIIWSKKAPMPESVTDRPTSAHEHIFLLSKRPTYYYDAEAVREANTEGTLARHGKGIEKPNGDAYTIGIPGQSPHGGFLNTNGHPGKVSGANLKNVWHLGPEPYLDAHFATFVTEIPRRCIKAGTSERGVCPACLSPWRRVVERYRTVDGERRDDLAAMRTGITRTSTSQGFGNWRIASESKQIGWQQGCACPAADPIPATVLDIFAGSGTTGLVADQLGRDAILIELSPAYAEMARNRVQGDCPMFTTVDVS